MAASPVGGTVRLRSGSIDGSRAGTATATARPGEPGRWVVRFLEAPGRPQRGALETVGARVVAPLPDQAFLVDVPAGRPIALSKIPGVERALPYLPQDKVAPELGRLAGAGKGNGDVAVVVHLFADADPRAVAAVLDTGLDADMCYIQSAGNDDDVTTNNCGTKGRTGTSPGDAPVIYRLEM